ncbi:MAG: sodium:solute symporter family protein [Desulfurococcales archaeon]|nr:sodium:solute symporter family protein [Desulfurococcales archaeon]
MTSSRLLISILLLVVYIIAGTMLALRYRSRAGRDARQFYIAGGRLSGVLSALTYAATTYSTFMIVGLVGFTYFTGTGALGFEIMYLIATLALLVTIGRRVWILSRGRGWVSPGEMLSDFYGSRRVAALASLVFLISLIPYAGAQLKAVGEAVAGLADGGDQYYILGVALGAIVMLVWSIAAGIWSVASTDALQGLWMLASSILLLFWLIYEAETAGLGITGVFRALDNVGLYGIGEFWKPHVFAAFTIPWMFFAVTNPQVVQRLYMPESKKAYARMVALFGFFGLLYTLIVTLIGVLARGLAESNTLSIPVGEGIDTVTPALLSIAHPLLAAMVFTSIVAAGVSTVDSILLALASSVERDLLRTENAQKYRTLTIIIVLAAMSSIALLRLEFIVLLSVLSSFMLLSLAPATIAGALGVRAKPELVELSIILGPITAIAGILYYGSPKSLFVASAAGIPISGILLLVSSLVLALGVQKARAS